MTLFARAGSGGCFGASAVQGANCVDGKCWVLEQICEHGDCSDAEAAEIPYSLLTAHVGSSEANVD